MSKYEWERGTIKLPSKDYPRFRKEIISTWNKHQLDIFAIAEDVFKRLKSASPKLKASELSSAVTKTIGSKVSEESGCIIRDLIIVRGLTGDLKLRAPRKADLKLHKVSKGCSLHTEDAGIHFDDKACSVTWSVPENNHAREHAHAHPIARELFSRLNKIQWVRGTGGTIVGNDEYNRDNDYEDGGGNYITAYYGPESGRRLHRF